MSRLPLISIGLCTFNGEAFIREQLDSLVAQTYRPLEIRIRDDRSQDQTVSIIREHQSQYPFIHLTENRERMGIQKNFEAVLLDCTGELLAPCDQDDIWHPDKLEILQRYLRDHLMVYHDSELIDQDGKSMEYRISDKFRLGNWENQEPFMLFNCISGHSMLFRKNLLKAALPIPEAGYYDHWLVWVCLGMGTIGFCPKSLVSYRQHQTNQTDLIGKKKKLSGLERTHARISRENSWLKACSEWTLPVQPSHSVIRLRDLALKREHVFFNFALGWEIWKNRSRVLGVLHSSSLDRLAFAFRYSMGLRAKNLFYSIR